MDTNYAPKDDYKKEMGKRLQKCRQKANLTQEKMAEILNISNKHYNEVERGITGLSINRLIFLSNFLNISLEHLLKGENDSETLPFTLVSLYHYCPDEKKGNLLDMLRSLAALLDDSRSDGIIEI